MRSRNIVASILAVLVAAGCIRLGLWQVDRHEQRRAINELFAARMSEPPARTLGELPVDTGTARYRAVELRGTFDFENEFALTTRTRNGSPGVNLITPLRIPDAEQAVLVNRGWVYAPDGVTVDFARWREPAAATVRGYVVPMPSFGERTAVQARSVRRLDHAYLSSRIPYPIAPIVVVDTAAGRGPDTPARIGGIALDAGPHLGYALQWFSFAAIALIGVAVLISRDRRRSSGRAAMGVASAGRAG